MESGFKELSRRNFIFKMTEASAAVMLNPVMSWALPNDNRVAKIVANTIGIDSHNHIDVPQNPAEVPGPKVDLLGEMRQSGLSAICMTFAVDYQKLTRPGEAYERFISSLDAMDQVLESNHLKRALNVANIKSAHKAKQPIVIQSVEGGHFLEGKLDRLGVAYNRGLRHLGLLHDNDASVPLGDVYTNPPQWGGLTTFGKEVITECNKLGILIDLTHASNKTIESAIKVSSKPMVISHTGLDTQLGTNEFMAKMMRPRLISREQAKIVAEAGGLIGVWTHLADSPLAYVQHIRAMVDVVGVDHVCIGTDTKMTPSYRPSDSVKPKTGKDANNQKMDQSARVGERTNEAWQDQKAGFYFAVIDAMLQIGFTEGEIEKIGGGNYLRLFDDATKGH